MEDLRLREGQRIGRWTILQNWIFSPRGEKKWLCHCDCGTERYVLERSLRYGGSVSCGCLRKEAAREAVAYDLAGKTFGDLTILGLSEKQDRNGGAWWRCRCSCSNICEYPATLLVTGKRTHCGCKTQRSQPIADITGQRFQMLTALAPTDRRSKRGSVIWRCRCDCGAEVDVSYNNLVYANQVSCGCRKKDHDQLLNSLQTRVDGTSLDIIRSSKTPTNNTTGIRGVYFIKGKYVAKLVFRKKQYYLGKFDTVAEAAQARKEAEEAVFQTTLAYHRKWQARAESDPQWAVQNPMQIFVTRQDDRLQASFLPPLAELEAWEQEKEITNGKKGKQGKVFQEKSSQTYSVGTGNHPVPDLQHHTAV